MRAGVEALRVRDESSQQPKTCPRPSIPAARLLFVFLSFSMLSFTWENPEVGGGDNFLGSYQAIHVEAAHPQLAHNSQAPPLGISADWSDVDCRISVKTNVYGILMYTVFFL